MSDNVIPKIIIHNAQTDEIIKREMTSEELANYENAKANYIQSQNRAIEAKAALLERLGITEEEAKLLLG